MATLITRNTRKDDMDKFIKELLMEFWDKKEAHNIPYYWSDIEATSEDIAIIHNKIDGVMEKLTIEEEQILFDILEGKLNDEICDYAKCSQVPDVMYPAIDRVSSWYMYYEAYSWYCSNICIG